MSGGKVGAWHDFEFAHKTPLQSLSVTPRSSNYVTNCYSETATHTLILPPRSAQTPSLSFSSPQDPPPRDNQPGASCLAVPHPRVSSSVEVTTHPTNLLLPQPELSDI